MIHHAARLAAVLFSVLATLAAAQPSAKPVPELSDQTIRRPAIGLTATLPVGASQETIEFGGRRTTTIQLPEQCGIVNILDHTLTHAQTLDGVAEDILRQRLETVSQINVDPDRPVNNSPIHETASGRLLSTSDAPVNGNQARMLYVQTASVGREDTVYGYALFMPSTNVLAMLELQTTASLFPTAKAYFELVVNSVAITDPTLTDAQRALGVEAGIAFFQSLEPSDYERVIESLGGEWRYERYFKPAPTGADSDATEQGYRRTRFAVGTRGDLQGERKGRGLDPTNRQKGYLVFQDARILDRDRIYDVTAGFFMTPDRRQEAWTIRQSSRHRNSPAGAATTLVETGLREKNAVTVVQTQGSSPAETVNPLIQGQGYVSRVEVYLLPHLMLDRGVEAAFRSYAYNQSARRITLREDSLRRSEEGSGVWAYTSKPDEESPGQTQFFNARLDPIRAELPGGQLWEPITLRKLFDLWKSKQLPLE